MKKFFFTILFSVFSSSLLGQTDSFEFKKFINNILIIDTLNYFYIKNDTVKLHKILNNNQNLDEFHKIGFLINFYNDSNKLNVFINSLQNDKNLFDIITSNNAGYQYFLFKNKFIIKDFINSFDNESEKLLMEFYLTDQTIRLRNSFIKLLNSNIAITDSFLICDSLFMKFNERLKDSIYVYYNKQNSIISNNNPYYDFYRMQLLLFAHETDIERRFFYLKLIKNAINNGIYKIETEMNFILRTEMIEKGTKKFFEDYDARIEEIRKEYNKPDYQFRVI